MNYLDLFAGAGGLSEGFINEGFKPIAHVEMDKIACDTLLTRTVFHYLKENNNLDKYYNYLKGIISREQLLTNIPKELSDSVIHSEISEKTLSEIYYKIDNLLNGENVDLIIGGVPCQSYSMLGRASNPNKMENDPRNHLYIQYFEFVENYKPKAFIIENVKGLLSADKGNYLKLMLQKGKDLGYDVDYKILNAKNFNVLQNRERIIIFGWQKQLNLSYPVFEENEPQYKIMKDLFSDLPKLKSGQGTFGCSEYNGAITQYLSESNIRNKNDILTQHIAKKTTNINTERYKILINYLNNENKKLKNSQFPDELRNDSSFENRYCVVNGNSISHTVIAHLQRDGNYYIHPDIEQNRSITPREAARIQSFPDNYFFEGSKTDAYRQIGNAVPPLMAQGIAKKIKKMLC